MQIKIEIEKNIITRIAHITATKEYENNMANEILQNPCKINKFATGEKSFKLDGTANIMKSGYACNVKSNKLSQYVTPIKITISLPVGVKQLAVKIFFGDVFAENAKIKWFYNTVQVASQDILNGTQNLDINKILKSIDKIEIEITKVNKPNALLKIGGIIVEQNITIDDNEITEINTFDESDFLCNSITSNELDISVINRNQKYNLLNPDGVYKLFADSQKVTLIDNISERIYFLINVENTSLASSKISANDTANALKKPYTNSIYAIDSRLKAISFFDDVFRVAGVTNYKIEAAIANTYLRGYISATTIREALQQICIATKSTLRVNSDNSIEIYRPIKPTSPKIFDNIIGGGEKVTLREKVNGVAVSYYDFSVENAIGEYSGGFDGSTYWQTCNYNFLETGINKCESITAPNGYNSPKNFICTKVRYTSSQSEIGIKDLNIRNLISNRINKTQFEILQTTELFAEIVTIFYGKNIIDNKSEKIYPYSTNPNITIDNKLITNYYDAEEIGKHWYNYLAENNANIEYDIALSDLKTTRAGDYVRIKTGFGTYFDNWILSIDTNVKSGICKIKGVGHIDI